MSTAERGRPRAVILGTHVDALGWDEALATVLAWADRRESRYVCHANVHAVVTARRDPAFRATLNRADLVTPDGMPLAWLLRWRGFAGQPRLSGPDFMWRFCARAAQHGLPIYLCGGRLGTLQRLTTRLTLAFPGLAVVGAEELPFREPTDAECERTAARIHAAGAHAVFVGLGCPKQERWMAAQRGRVNAVMFGVGAALDFHAGTAPRAPRWMQHHGLEWLHRLASDPRRLARRYLVTNSLFVLYLAQQFLQRPFSGHRDIGG